jgi:acyl carrier protein
MATRAEIFAKVKDTLVDALGVDDDEVTPEATLIGDLGAESIDFLDIIFRLEKNFSIKIPRGELFPENLALADQSLIKDGVVTPEGISELRKRMPHADVDKFATDPKVENINELFTVDMMVNFLETKLAAG